MLTFALKLLKAMPFFSYRNTCLIVLNVYIGHKWSNNLKTVDGSKDYLLHLTHAITLLLSFVWDSCRFIIIFFNVWKSRELFHIIFWDRSTLHPFIISLAGLKSQTLLKGNWAYCVLSFQKAHFYIVIKSMYYGALSLFSCGQGSWFALLRL